MTIPDDKEKQESAASIDGDDWWPFGDVDLDEYEQALEESIARGEWRSVPNFAAEKARYEEMARIALATGNYGPVPEGVPCPPDWPEYVRGGVPSIVAEARALKNNSNISPASASPSKEPCSQTDGTGAE